MAHGHVATTTHKSGTYCCECDFCRVDGIQCAGAAYAMFFEPYDPSVYIMSCENHIANGIAACHEYLTANPGSRIVHNLFDSDYISGRRPEVTT